MSSLPTSSLGIVFFLTVLSNCQLSIGEKRSDDPDQLAAVVEQLVQRVSSLEASKTALETEVSSLKTKLAAKRCESGSQGFQPHKQDSVVHPDGGVERMHTKHVPFSSPFSSVPKVTVGFTALDADHLVNTRVSASVTNLQASGFDLTLKEWADSNTYGVSVMWMACSN